MRSMKERVQMLEGTIHIASFQGKGTVITIDLPVEQTGDVNTDGPDGSEAALPPSIPIAT